MAFLLGFVSNIYLFLPYHFPFVVFFLLFTFVNTFYKKIMVKLSF
nr:MAG TPA: hypothetical protein [Caudoviricetes sp.]